MTVIKDNKICPCGSSKEYVDCCGLLIEGHQQAKTAEQLMRSRYTAFHQKHISYIAKTCWPLITTTADRLELEASLKAMQWHGLTILKTAKGKGAHNRGTVTFRAQFTEIGKLGVMQVLEEKSSFRKIDGVWYYTEGVVQTLEL